MAIRTKSPGRSWSAVSPYSNYASVVSNYGVALANAQEEEKNTELETKLLAYKNGTLTYNELTSYLQARLVEETPGTAKELALRQTLSDAADYEQDQQVKINRAKMMEQFSKGGISADEQAQIEQNLLQYYKPGSANYAQQLAVISTAKETARVEKNNAKVAKLQGELSSGGLSKNEQVQVLEEMKKYAEPGSQDALDIDAKIGTTKEKARKEDQQKAINAKTAELYNKYGDGGITDQEKLAMIKELEPLVDKNSAEYVALKEQEAVAAGAIAKTGKGDAKTALVGQVAAQQAALGDLETKFNDGTINADEYMKQKEGLLSLIAPQDLPAGTLDPKDMYSLKKEFTDFQQMKTAVASNQVVPIKFNNKQVMVTLQDLTSFKYSDDVPFQVTDPTTGVTSQEMGKKITLVGKDGSEANYSLNGDGTFTPVQITKGIDPNGLTKTFYTKDPKAKAISAQDLMGTSAPATTTTTTPKVGTIQSGPIAPSPGFKTEPKPKTPSPSIGSKVKSDVKKVTTPIISTLKTTAPTTLGSLFGPVGTAVGSIISSAKPTTGKINIGSVNIPDYGVTEKIGSIFNQAKSTVSSFLGSIFGKR